ncbi:MAG: AAA family ATPase [bacterium]
MLSINNPEYINKLLAEHSYISDMQIDTVLYLMLNLKKPLLIEGEAGVGKTEIAKVLAQALDAELIRLQCYSGIDENKALYEWNYQKQLLSIQLKEDLKEKDLFSREYLLARPLLKALTNEKRTVLLIDEIDKVEEEFEAFLLEILSDFQVSIPEYGTVAANQRPIVILTSNSTRNLSDALKRRCLYLYLEYPEPEKEKAIITAKVPDIETKLAEQIVSAVKKIRQQLKIKKKPSISETIDWAEALLTLGAKELTAEFIEQTTSALFKFQQDYKAFTSKGGAEWLLKEE